MTCTDVPVVLEAKGVTKGFSGVLANDRIDLSLRRGEILALLGENGAGKTTLMNILYGLYRPDQGETWIKGERVELGNPNDAIKRGVGMVHQHFQLVPVLTVAENVILGAEITGFGGRLDRRQAEDQVRDLSQRFRLQVDPTAVVEDLPVGTQQRLEILKALYRKVEILILDEPTAVLTPGEANDLFRIMDEMVRQGGSIIFITHKLKEALAVADRIGVLRGGKMIGVISPGETTEARLAEMMVGRKVTLRVGKSDAHPGQPVLRVENLKVRNDRKQIAVDAVSLEVCEGEVLGIAGVEGNGQRELVEALTGLRRIERGQVWLGGRDSTRYSPRGVTASGVAHIPTDRDKHGLVMSYSIADNIALNRYYQPPYARGIVLHRERINADCQTLLLEYDVQAPSVFAPAATLSGGNKQKVVVAREFSRPVKLLIAAQPTRGIDVGSIEFIHRRILAQRDSGVAVLLVSAELDEVLSLSDRVAVMFEGQIAKTLPISEATRERVGLLMAGSDA